MKTVLKIALIYIIPAVLLLSGCNTDVISVTGITLDKTSESVVVGGVTLLTAAIEPAEATNTDVSWSSSDETIAVVSESGIVIGMVEGTATITATTDDGGFTASCAVAVGAVGVTGISVNPNSMDLDAGETGQLEVFINPGNATNLNVTWESGNAFIATIDENGAVTGRQAGETTITVTANDGGFASTSTANVEWVPTTGNVDSHQKISDTEGGFTGALDDSDSFGSSVTSPGDLDGNGVADLVVGAYSDDGGGSDRGAVWVLFMEEE